MEWYLLKSGRVEGPFNNDYMQTKIGRGDLSTTDLVCRKGDRHWRPLSEFQGEFTENPETEPTLRPWIVLVENNPSLDTDVAQPHYVQSGPYSTEQVVANIQKGETKYSDYIWKPGFDRWLRINEVDDFFGQHVNKEEGKIEFENDLKGSNFEEAPLGQVMQQVSPLDFLEEDEPAEASGFDQLAMKPLVPVETEVKYPIFQTDLPTVIEELDVQHEAVALAQPHEKNTEVVAEPARAAKSLWSRSFILLVLSTIAVAITGLFCVWYFLIQGDDREGFDAHPARRNPVLKHVVAKNLEPVPEIKKPDIAVPPLPLTSSVGAAAASPTTVAAKPPIVLAEKNDPARAPKVKMVLAGKKVHKNLVLSKVAKIYEKEAILLERQYIQLQENPLAWKNFYSDWKGELNSAALKPAGASSQEIHTLLLNRKRLIERSEMMNRSVLESRAVSSDFGDEDLPRAFRKLEKR